MRSSFKKLSEINLYAGIALGLYCYCCRRPTDLYADSPRPILLLPDLIGSVSPRW